MAKLKKLPTWAGLALQGVVHWIGHRRCLYKDYELPEGAIVAEICNLIHANLTDDLVLQCEVMYSKLLPDETEETDIFSEFSRTDLVIAEKPVKKGDDPIPRFVVEVKRAKASAAEINKDLVRLAEVRRLSSGVRAFLFVVSEAQRPRRFVTPDGTSKIGRQSIPECDGYFRVRRTWKAAHAFKMKERAQYACLIEVYA